MFRVAKQLDFREKLQLLHSGFLVVALEKLQDVIIANVRNDLSRVESSDDVLGFRVVPAFEQVDPAGRVEGDVFRLKHRCRGTAHSRQ